MAISETARRNHEELFPGHVSTLARTDPELIEVFDNFAFDQVLAHVGVLETRTGLDLATRELLTYAMLISLGGCEPQVRGHVAATRRVGAGRTLLLAGHDEASSNKAADQLRGEGYEVAVQPADISDQAQVQALATTAEGMGPVTQVIMAGGVSPTAARTRHQM